MFKNKETGRFSPKMIVDTTKLVLKDIMPLSSLYAQTSWGTPLLDTINKKRDIKSPDQTPQPWYSLPQAYRAYIKFWAVALESMCIPIATFTLIYGNPQSAAFMFGITALMKGTTMGLIRTWRRDLK